MRTDIEIRDDIYAYIKGSELESAVNGKLCNKPSRPKKSNKEDICIDVLSNEQYGDKQIAVVYVRIYVPDINHNGQMEENTPRLRAISMVADKVLASHNGGAWRFDLKSIKSYDAKDIHTHFVASKLEYQTITN